jgi:hypothetical protein
VVTDVVRSCQCAVCGSGLEHPDLEYHRQMNLLMSRLDEQQRRWYLAVESQRLGRGADRLLLDITGVDEKTIRRGRSSSRMVFIAFASFLVTVSTQATRTRHYGSTRL